MIITSKRSRNFSPSRVRFLVLHYTALPFEESLDRLTQGEVSVHYLVPESGLPIYNLVDESSVAWHAGVSSWGSRVQLNDTSVGIEIVNMGGGEPFPDAQIEAVITLSRDIIERHKIEPQNVLGHSDIAPQRKVDPGPAFPWYKLYVHGVGAWFDALPPVESADTSGGWVRENLGRYGYNLDGPLVNVVKAFQMHFRPRDVSGVPDAETCVILRALLEKYHAN